MQPRRNWSAPQTRTHKRWALAVRAGRPPGEDLGMDILRSGTAGIRRAPRMGEHPPHAAPCPAPAAPRRVLNEAERRRLDEAQDANFYATARMMHHADAAWRAQLTGGWLAAPQGARRLRWRLLPPQEQRLRGPCPTHTPAC